MYNICTHGTVSPSAKTRRQITSQHGIKSTINGMKFDTLKQKQTKNVVSDILKAFDIMAIAEPG